MKENHLYKGYHIYTMQLRNQLWAASVTRIAVPTGATANYSGHYVDGIGGEFGSEDQAISAARQYIDQKEERHEH
ncbi:MAG: hypothetical protein WCK89_22775, partial [bacterium]